VAGWRRWNRAIHRDAGYLCVGLTLLYALSGIALNHLHDWNSGWRFERTEVRFAPPASPATLSEERLAAIVGELGGPEPPTALFRRGPAAVRAFFPEGRVVDLDLADGVARGELARPRPVLGRMNALHLNRGGRAWTWLTDLYAGVLALLAVTGALILRGREGLRGRGGWLVAAGVLLPLAVGALFLRFP